MDELNAFETTDATDDLLMDVLDDSDADTDFDFAPTQDAGH